MASDSADRVSVHEEVNHTLLALLPWTASVLLHMGLVLMAFFVVWSMTQQEDTPPIHVTVGPHDDRKPEIVINRDDVKLDEKLNKAESRRVDSLELPNEHRDLTDAMKLNQKSIIQVIGLPRAPEVSGWKRTGRIFGDDDRNIGGGGEAQKQVFVIDASGSLVDTLAYVIRDLVDRLNSMDDQKRFSVIFFQRDMAIEAPPAGLKKVGDYRARVIDWITLEHGNIVPRGTSNPTAALKLALARKPDVIWLISDNITGSGMYQVTQENLLSTIRQQKAASGCPNVRINTIQFLYPDPLGTLKAIADANNGLHKFVSESDLQGEGANR